MILYLFKTILCSGLLLIAYQLLLQREKMLQFNRFYLLFSLLFSFTVPLIHFSVETAILLQPQVIASEANTGILVNVVPENTPATLAPAVEQNTINWWYFVAAIYAAGYGLLLFRFGKNLFRLVAAIRTNEVQIYGNARLVLLNEPTIPHSFFHFIFLNKEDYENGLIQPEVLCHERTHVDQKHSLDIVLIELLFACCWFNPVLYFYRKAIRLNHEFLADEAVIKRFDNAPVYQQLLLQTATVSTQPFPASSFTYSITKKRFLMMTKNTSLSKAIVKVMAILPVLSAMVFLFSERTIAQVKNTPKKKQQDTSNLETKTQPDKVEKEGEELGADPWARLSVGHTKEGTTDEQLKEYAAIIDKYKIEGKWWHTFSTRVSEQDRNRLESIFKQMSFTQQGEQFLIFTKPSNPLPRVVPTKAQFEAFKNVKVYGLWINEKHVNNTALNKFTNTDFAQFIVSKLYGPAAAGRSYTHQLDMMTNEYYQAYYDKTLANRKSPIGFALNNHPVDSIRQKFRMLNGKPRIHVQNYSSNEVTPSRSSATTYPFNKIDSTLRNITISEIRAYKRMGNNLRGLMQEN